MSESDELTPLELEAAVDDSGRMVRDIVRKALGDGE